MKKLVLLLIAMVLFAPIANAKEKIEVSTPDFGVYIFKINTKKYGDKIKPYVTSRLTTPQKLFDDNCFDLVVNGGFFDTRNGKSVSYVVIDNKLEADIKDHVVLVKNLKNEKRLEKILNRAELRILENKRHKLRFDIAHHADPVKKGYKIKHSLQAGPMLKPTMDLVKEGFVEYENDIVKSQSADILKRRERTALALKGKHLYIVIFTNDYKVDAHEMLEYIQNNIKAKKILALDGGLSTAINYKNISIGSVGNRQRKVKSFLVIER